MHIQEVFLVAAERLSVMATAAELQVGALFPPFARIRDISAHVMAAAAAHLVDAGLGAVPDGWPEQREGWAAAARQAMWSPPLPSVPVSRL